MEVADNSCSECIFLKVLRASYILGHVLVLDI